MRPLSRPRFARLPLSPVAAIVAFAGCVSSSSTPSPPSGDGGASLDASEPAIACTEGVTLADGACNDLENLDTTPVTGTCQSGAQPVGTGGTIASGTYLMTAQARYDEDAGCTPEQYEATLVIDGTCSARIDVSDGASLTRNTSFTTNGNVLTRTATCGASLPAATYTATASQFILFDQGGAVTTWTKL